MFRFSVSLIILFVSMSVLSNNIGVLALFWLAFA